MANLHESALHYPLGDALPASGTTIEVAPGVRWLRMPLPFALDHINLWLLRDRQEGVEGWTIVDCGIDNDTTRAAWELVFEHELQGLPVLRVVVTHMHPDHIGLAHWLTERWSGAGAGLVQAGAGTRGGQAKEAAAGAQGGDCRLWISATDWNAGRMASRATTGVGGENAARFFARHGLNDPESLARVHARGNYYASMVPQVPGRFRRLMDGMELDIGGRAWHCMVGYGHAPEHIALCCPDLEWAPEAPAAPPPQGGLPRFGTAQRRGVLISGDMVLPRISTNVSVIDIEPEADPLPLYLKSIAAMRALPAGTLVLPSHGKPFTGLHERISQLEAHHEERLAEVLAACREAPCSAADLLEVMFKRKLDLHQTTFAMGESIAHVHALQAAGQLAAEPGADGVLRWRTVD